MNADLLNLFWHWAWRTSVEALPLALIAILFWRLRGLPPAWRWWLPALFFLRLAMPQVPEASWQRWGLEALSSRAPAAVEVVAASEVSGPAEAATSFPILAALWALGCIAVGGWTLISHWRLGRAISRWAGPADAEMEQHAVWAAAHMGLSRCVPLRVMPGWSPMAVHGWLKPELLIPADLAERFSVAQIRGMFLHEMAHVRRRDVLWTWLALGLCTLHWFNPLAWLALRRFHADRELACDAAALHALDPDARHDYGEALLLCLQGPALHSAPALAPFFRRFPELKQRLQNIMTPTSPTLRSRLAIALLIPTLAAFTFTTARAQREADLAKPTAPKLQSIPLIQSERDPAQSIIQRVQLDRATPPENGEGASPLREEGKPKIEKREGEGGKEKMRAGDGSKTGPRDGEKPRDGENPRDGERMRKGEREGDGDRKAGPRDGEERRRGPRDGDQPKAGPRDGEGRKGGPRDGEQPRRGSRDGEGKREGGPRDGEGMKKGPRDGEGPKAGPREGDAGKPPRDGEKPPREGDGEKPEAR